VRESRSTSPVTFFFLVLPTGISAGFVGVTLPFVLTRAGFSVGAAAAIVAVGLSANIWRFLWGPVADLTLSLRKWYWIGLGTCAATLFLLSLIPIRHDRAALLTTMVFISQVAATLVVLPLGGLMAHTVAEQAKGRAAGWYQAGNLGGTGLGGGAGVWLAAHFSTQAAGSVLALTMLLCAAALFFMPDVRPVAGENLGRKMREMGKDFRDLVRSPIVLLTAALVTSPIGAGGAANLWSAIAPDWHASPDTVALATGLLSSVASFAGCIVGGYMADRVGRWWTYFVAGVFMALVAIIMAAAPRTPFEYSSWVLLYAVSTGMGYAAFSALLLNAIGRGAAATKYAILASVGNIPCVYMTALDGWAYDRWHASGMLNFEAWVSVAFVVVGLWALWKVNARAPRRRLVGAEAPT
jgi:MFS transporter, PAT family, beta-lactamase induction signal transducer AmpG